MTRGEVFREQHQQSKHCHNERIQKKKKIQKSKKSQTFVAFTYDTLSMPEGGKRKTTDPLTESSAPRRRRFIKSEPGASYSDPAMWHLKEKKQRKRVQVEAVELHHEPSHYTWSTLHGYPYPYVYANDGKRVASA